MSLLASYEKASILSEDVGRMKQRAQKLLASETASYNSQTGFKVRERLRKKLPYKPADPKELVESYNATLSLMRSHLASRTGRKEIEAQKKAILAMEQSRDKLIRLIQSSE